MEGDDARPSGHAGARPADRRGRGGGVPALLLPVHQVCPDLQEPGGLLRPACAPAEAIGCQGGLGGGDREDARDQAVPHQPLGLEVHQFRRHPRRSEAHPRNARAPRPPIFCRREAEGLDVEREAGANAHRGARCGQGARRGGGEPGHVDRRGDPHHPGQRAWAAGEPACEVYEGDSEAGGARKEVEGRGAARDGPGQRGGGDPEAVSGLQDDEAGAADEGGGAGLHRDEGARAETEGDRSPSQAG
mmetsp:Transcript_10103/g.23621  ORF Transcript_10103/g.23621 Transcript_10103/m.23621 type:complete len:246 (+) Transcript_10103:144-881(+)